MACLCDVLSRLGLHNPIQKPKHHQNGHFLSIGGHFESWRPSCFLKITRISQALQSLYNGTCLDDVLSKSDLQNSSYTLKRLQIVYFYSFYSPYLKAHYIGNLSQKKAQPSFAQSSLSQQPVGRLTSFFLRCIQNKKI